MNNELRCSQVLSLINFYIEDKLTPKWRELVEKHLKNCKNCNKKYHELNTVLTKYKLENKNISLKTADENENTNDEELVAKFSAYIDNELNPNENVKIKKIAISNPNARKKLDSMYKFRQLLQSAYQKTKSNSRIDYSKEVISKTHNVGVYNTTCFYKIILIFCILITGIIAGFMYLYF